MESVNSVLATEIQDVVRPRDVVISNAPGLVIVYANGREKCYATATAPEMGYVRAWSMEL